MPWPPQVGELLPRYDEPVGIEEKLRAYSLAIDHTRGGPKARGFKKMLGIDLGSIAHLESAIREGIATTRISMIEPAFPGGFDCTVQFQILGPGSYSHRSASLRTVWELADPGAPPRLITAFLRGKEQR